MADFVRSNSFLACVPFRFGRQQRLQRRQCIASAPSNVTSDATLRPVPVRRQDEFCRFALRSQVLACRRLCSGARLQRTRHQGRRRLRLRLQEPRRASGLPPQSGSLFVRSGTCLRRPGCGHILRPNNSFKPKLLRSGNGVAKKACHAATCATQFGLTQALGRSRAGLPLLQRDSILIVLRAACWNRIRGLRAHLHAAAQRLKSLAG